MFIGHLPAGYLATRRLQRALDITGYMWLGLLASVFPDIDLFWFYFVDHRRAMHHHYWIHRPFVWLVIAALWFSLCAVESVSRRWPRLRLAGLIFFPNIFLHLLLDTIVGKIDWLYPIYRKGYCLFDVPATHHDWYVTNYLVHWTFIFEVVIVVWAGATFFADRARRQRLRTAPSSS